MPKASGSKASGSKKTRDSEFNRCFQQVRPPSNPNTRVRMDVDSDGVKATLVRLPPPMPPPPIIHLLDPLCIDSHPIDIETDDEGEGEEEEEEEEEEDPSGKAPQTQTRYIIDQLMEKSDLLQDLIMQSYHNNRENQLCPCGNRQLCTVHCYECFQYSTSCPTCFAASHYNQPFHWAYLWHPEDRYFKKVDSSIILEIVNGSGAIQLGHIGERKPCPSNDTVNLFTITHTNGVHSTKIRTCQCPGAPDKMAQLMEARLFPATTRNPRSAFTFAVLKEYHMHGLQSKSAAFDYIWSLRRLTNNNFAQTVPDPYKSFLRISRIWDFLSLKKWVGQAHDIDTALPHRPAGSITTGCPTCVEIGVNTTKEEVEACPTILQHIVTNFKTADGNHHANRYNKNSDRTDVSLWEGYFSYFPSREVYAQYLDDLPANIEKSVCNFITAVNAQDKKKFRGCDETGVINIQCRHVLVESCVDMYFGEKFVYADFGLSHSLDARPQDGIRLVVAYDTACSYSVNVLSRFSENLPRHVDTIANILFTIDSLHVHDHQDRCIYLYSTYYQDNTGHFHGVGTEQFWAESNQYGSQIRQMNPGHRQDKMVQGNAEWNQKKVTRMSRQLARELRISWANFTEKRDDFKKLSEVQIEDVKVWVHLDRRPTVNGKKEVLSVYRHSPSKVHSLDSVSKRLLHDEESSRKSLTSSENPIESPIVFLTEGINLKRMQIHLRQLIERNRTHPLIATQRDIKATRKEIKKQLEKWREQQTIHMNSVKSRILECEPQQPENETLFLPSDLSRDERMEMELVELAELEADLWEGMASECIMRLRSIGKTISAFEGLREKNVKGQHGNTRSRSRIQSIQFLQAHVLATYEDSRRALNSLGRLSSMGDRFPHLTIHDLFRKSTQHKRSLGDTHRSDGPLYGLSGKSHKAAELSTSRATQTETDGKLWDPIAGLSDEDFTEWNKEEDRVQWFRAWAEMMRWMEEFELKHAEFARCIRSFRKMCNVWEGLASKSTRPGYAAFAQRQATVYRKLATDAELLFVQHGEERFVHPETTLVDAILDFRRNELSWFVELARIPSHESIYG